MKVILLSLIFLSFLFSEALTQSLSARISNPRIESGKFKWDVEINRTDDWGPNFLDNVLGNCDFYFNVNRNGFTAGNPALSNIHSALSGNANYSFTTGRASSGSRAWIALTYVNGPGTNWYPPLNSWQLLFTASLDIADPAQNSGLTWRASSTAFSRGNQQPLTETLSGDGDISLPVDLTAFSATAEADKIVLKWTTQSEVNNLGFEVYRSGEETGAYAMIASFENTPALQGGGNSNTAREYTYEDAILSNGGTYWYQIADVDYQGVRTFHGPVSAQAPDLIPEAYALRPNYPNPFNPETTIRFEVPADPASNGKIALAIYNNLGMVVRTLVSGSVQPGIHAVKWDGRNDRGDQMASGVYFLRLQAGSFVQTQKMLLVR